MHALVRRENDLQTQIKLRETSEGIEIGGGHPITATYAAKRQTPCII